MTSTRNELRGCDVQAVLTCWQGARSRCGRLKPAPPHGLLCLARKAQLRRGPLRAPDQLGQSLTPGQAVPARAALPATRPRRRPRACMLRPGAVAGTLATERVEEGWRAREATRGQWMSDVRQKRALTGCGLRGEEAGMRKLHMPARRL